jgi:hypothetical protein
MSVTLPWYTTHWTATRMKRIQFTRSRRYIAAYRLRTFSATRRKYWKIFKACSSLNLVWHFSTTCTLNGIFQQKLQSNGCIIGSHAKNRRLQCLSRNLQFVSTLHCRRRISTPLSLRLPLSWFGALSPRLHSLSSSSRTCQQRCEHLFKPCSHACPQICGNLERDSCGAISIGTISISYSRSWQS